METIKPFTGKNLSGVKKVVLSTVSDVDSFVKPIIGLDVSATITYITDAEVISITGTLDKCGFECNESDTEHGELFSSRVVIEAPKVTVGRTENFFDMLRKRLFLLVTLANDQVRILGDTGDDEDVICTVNEMVSPQSIGENKYLVEFAWQSSHPPYFYRGDPPETSEEGDNEGGE